MKTIEFFNQYSLEIVLLLPIVVLVLSAFVGFIKAPVIDYKEAQKGFYRG